MERSLSARGWVDPVRDARLGANRVTGQIVLYEGTNVIEMHVTNIDGSGGRRYTQGIENAAGTVACFVPGRSAATFGVASEA